VLGVLLAGIVAMQVSLLRLNASMGRAIEQGTTLQAANGQLRAQVASLGAVSRIERLAANMGMVMAAPAQLTFLSPRPGGIRRRAIANMTAPSTSALGTVQAAASTTAQSTAATTAAGSTTTPSTSSTATVTPSTVAGPSPNQSTGTTPTAPVSGTVSTPTGAAPTGTGAAPTGAAGVQPTAGGTTATAGAGLPASGGASSTGTGG
jgi:cell division protein FtsL